MIKDKLGGITGPNAPAAAEMEQAKEVSYFCFFISGIIIPPMQATVAGPDPEIAAKIMLVNTVTIPKAPLTFPRKRRQKFTNRLDMPPTIMISPASIKKGTASREKESTPLKYDCIIISIGIEEKKKIYVILAIPSETAIGRFRNSMNKNIRIISNPPITTPFYINEYSSG
jgi:hypothetical protein